MTMTPQHAGGIAWTDYTANPLRYRTQMTGRVVWACEKVSAGCTHCYAEALSRRYTDRRAGDWNAATMGALTPFLDERELHKMLTSKKIAGKRVFVGDMTDMFGGWVPDELLDRLFAVFALRSDVTWQVLTKRADLMREYFRHAGGPHVIRWSGPPTTYDRIKIAAESMMKKDRLLTVKWPLPHVWLGVSVENQETADERIPHLLQTPAAARFISVEPLLAPINLSRFLTAGDSANQTRALNWVVAGGESGPGARPCRVAWLRAVVRQCRKARVACFVKQLGADVRDRNDAGFMGEESYHWPETIFAEDRIEHDLDGTRDGYQGAAVRIHLKDRKGGDPAEWPDDLRVREWPRTAVTR